MSAVQPAKMERVQGIRTLDHILVGGGRSFISTCPHVVTGMRRRGVERMGVVIVEHDEREAEGLQTRLARIPGVDVRVVLLDLPSYRYEQFRHEAAHLGHCDLTPETLPNDNPQVIEIRVRLHLEEIASSVQGLLEKDNGPQDVLVTTLFAITGPTASTVAMEAVPLVLDELRHRKSEMPAIRTWNLRSLGFPMMSPSPEDGAGPNNIGHGRGVAVDLMRRMSNSEGDRPFDRALMLDGGFMVLDLPEFAAWAGETIATVLTARTTREEGEMAAFQDPTELYLNLPHEFLNTGLIRAGFGADVVSMAKALATLARGEETAMPEVLRKLPSAPALEEALATLKTHRTALSVLGERNGVERIFADWRGREERKLTEQRDIAHRAVLEQLGHLVSEIDEEINGRWFHQLRVTPSFVNHWAELAKGDDILEALSDADQKALYDAVQSLALYAIDPRLAGPELHLLWSLAVGRHDTVSRLGLNRKALGAQFGNGNMPEMEQLFATAPLSNSVEYLLLWRPRHGAPMPRYYAEDEDRRADTV